MLHDLRIALRSLRRQRGLSFVIVLTLALAIGVNTAIFSLTDALMLKSLPVHDPQSLYVLQWSANRDPGFQGWSSYGDCADVPHGDCSFSLPFYQSLRQQPHPFSGLTASAGQGTYNVSGHGAPSFARGQIVAGNYFDVLGVRPVMGRLLRADDDTASAPLVAVVSYDYWQTQLAGAKDVVGTTVNLNNQPATIVGVAEPRFTSLTPGGTSDLWLPLYDAARLNPNPAWWEGRTRPTTVWLTLLARLAPGVTPASAQAEVSGMFRNVMLAGPNPLSKPADNPHVTLLTAQDGLQGTRGEYGQSDEVLSWTVGAILLLACANIAGLLLGRASARRKEFAVRRALGAGVGRILRQLMTESLLLAAAGGALGLGLGYVGAQALVAFMSGAVNQPLGLEVTLDGRVLLFALAATLLTGLLFGLAPGLRGGRADLTIAMKDVSGNDTAQRSRRWRWLHLGNGLVVAQMALCMMVLAGAGLLVRTLANLRAVNPGFDTHGILLFSVSPGLIGYKGEAMNRLYGQLQQHIAAVPGVTAVTYTSDPLLSQDQWGSSYQVDPRPNARAANADTMAVGLDFFSTMHMPIRLGRAFVPDDIVAPPASAVGPALPAAKKSNAPPVAIVVNELFVQRYLGPGNPIGRVFGAGARMSPGGWRIVGVAANAKYSSLRRELHPTVFLPQPQGNAWYEVRTAAGDPLALLPAVRRAVAAVDQNLPLYQPSTQAIHVDRILFRERLLADLSSCFAALALLLACIGLYGLLAQEVTRRTREIGIRMALGAQRGRVLAMIVGGGFALTVAGLALGLAGAWGLTRYLHSLLFGVTAMDAITLAAVGALLVIVALAACLIPARRAARVDPLVALRYE